VIDLNTGAAVEEQGAATAKIARNVEQPAGGNDAHRGGVDLRPSLRAEIGGDFAEDDRWPQGTFAGVVRVGQDGPMRLVMTKRVSAPCGPASTRATMRSTRSQLAAASRAVAAIRYRKGATG
jgi:hypothetical protein